MMMQAAPRALTAAAAMMVVMGLIMLVAPVAAERGTRAVQGYGLVESVQQFLGLLVAGELFSVEGLQKHRDLLEHLVSKGLSTAIICGSAILKVPQILAIVNSGSVVGLSLLSLYFELVSGLGSVLYNLHAGNPFVAYGESFFILVQNLLLLYFLWSLAKPAVSIQHRALAVLVIGGFAAVGWWLPEHKEYLVLLQPPLLLAMKAPQIWTNFQNGHTGQLALLTVFMGMGGSLARMFTTLKELGAKDPQMRIYGLAALLNVVLFAQMVVYYNETQRVTGGGKGGKKGGASKAAAASAPAPTRVTRASARGAKTKKAD